MAPHLRHKPLATRAVYLRRLLRNFLVAVGIVTGSLFLGMVGYHGFEGLSWLDAFLNASMILTGMGPVNELHTTGGKLFAGCYAIFSGVVFITMAAVLFAPALHRFLHRFHLEITPDEPDSEPKDPRHPAGDKERPA
jgi:hypothetical protein